MNATMELSAVMENLVRSVARLQQCLEQAGIPSAVIGGLAVSAWGEPRLTRDADLKGLARRDERYAEDCLLQFQQVWDDGTLGLNITGCGNEWSDCNPSQTY